MGKLSFGATGLSYQVDSVQLKTTGAPSCPRCKQRVFFMEQMLANGKSWHKKCFSCVSCKKSLDSTNCCAHEEEIYCNNCHKRDFGPKGYGFAGGAAGLSTDSSKFGRRQTSQTSPPRTKPSAQGSTRSPVNQQLLGDVCPRCSKRVYQAEEVKANGKSWHRLCFKCGVCSKMLERGRTNEHEGDLYCNACYTRNYGIRGYGFAGGNGSLLSSTTAAQKGRARPSMESPAVRNGSPHGNGASSAGTSPTSNSLEGSPRGGSPLGTIDHNGQTGVTDHVIAHHNVNSIATSDVLRSNEGWNDSMYI